MLRQPLLAAFGVAFAITLPGAAPAQTTPTQTTGPTSQLYQPAPIKPSPLLTTGAAVASGPVQTMLADAQTVLV